MHSAGRGPRVAYGFDPRTGNGEWKLVGLVEDSGTVDRARRDLESGEGTGDPLEDCDPWVGRNQCIVEVPVNGFLEILRFDRVPGDYAMCGADCWGPDREERRLVQSQSGEILVREPISDAF